MLILPVVVGLLPSGIGDAITKYLPSEAGGTFINAAHNAGALSPGTGLGAIRNCLWRAYQSSVRGGAILMRRELGAREHVGGDADERLERQWLVVSQASAVCDGGRSEIGPVRPRLSPIGLYEPAVS